MYTPNFEYLLIIIEEGNLSRAAERCHVTQQSLSSYIRRLEEHYGIQIFSRSRGSRLSLTRAGEEVLSSARQIQESLSLLESDLDDLRRTHQTIFIGVANPLGRIIPRLLPIGQIAKALPHAHISIIEEDMIVLLPQLKDGVIDFLISSANLPQPNFGQLELRKTLHYLVISEQLFNDSFTSAKEINLKRMETGVSLLDFIPIPCVLYSTHGFTRNLIQTFCYTNRVQLSPLGTLNNASAILQTISEKEAWGYCPEDILPAHKGSSFIYHGIPMLAFPIRQPDLSFTISLFWNKRHSASPEFRAVLEMISNIPMHSTH